MWPKRLFKGGAALFALLILTISVAGGLLAQDAEPAVLPTETPLPTETQIPTNTPTLVPTATTAPQIVVNDVQPGLLTEGIGGVITVNGANFSAQSSVLLNGSIQLPLTSQSANTLSAAVGSSVPAGSYSVEVIDPVSGADTASNQLVVTEPTAVPRLSVSQSEPSQITAGQSGTLSILGANFSSNTTIRIIGYGLLQTTFVNSGALTAALPSNLPAGEYGIEISDPTTGTANAPGTLHVVAPQATIAPVTPTVIPTATPSPTAVPGQPELVIRNFSANPATINPGGTTQLTFEVVNVGSRAAQGIVVQLGDTYFAPANGQSSIVVPDLPNGASYTVSLGATAPMEASEGAHNIPIEMISRDFSGSNYNDSANVSVNVAAIAEGSSQVVLDSYTLEPSTAAPGDEVTLRALFKNTGSATAEQVLVQLNGENSILIGGSGGDSFAIGNMPAGAVAPVVMQFVVSAGASAGAQAQSLAISYLQDGEQRSSSASISLTVEEVVEATPLLLLNEYSIDDDDQVLNPGDQFSFNLALKNAGSVDIADLLLTFGTVQSSSGGTGSENSGSGGTTITPSTDFVIYGSGGRAVLGDLVAGESVALDQSFLVSSALTSGIHELPITIQYTLADGTQTTQSLSASLMVVVPPNLRLAAEPSFEDALTPGEEYTLSVDIVNLGEASAALTEMRVTGDNVTITDGASAVLDPLQGDDDTTQIVTFTPEEEGEYEVTVEVDYIDDLNRTQTVTTTVSGDVSAPQRVQMMPPWMAETVQEQAASEPETVSVGQLLLGFLGLGG